MFWWIALGVAVAAVIGICVLVKLETRSRRKDQATLAQHPEHEQLLCFGALMGHRNNEPTRLLLREGEYKVSYSVSPDDIRECLAEAWDITDAQSARNTLHELIVEGRRASFDVEFRRLQQGESLSDLTSFNGEDYLRWKNVKATWIEAGLTLSDNLSMAAFDYERIAWVARSSFHVGYLSEQEVWRCLAWVAAQSVCQFESWQNYAASYVLGRAATYSGESYAADGVTAAKHLLFENDRWLDRPSLWQDYPLANIRAPQALLAPLVESKSTSIQDQLLGLGALSAWGRGQRFDELAIRPHREGVAETWLADSWNVADCASAVTMLDWLVEKGSRLEEEASFRHAVSGVGTHQVDEPSAIQLVQLRHAKRALSEAWVDSALVAGCRTMLAYDLERAAYVARVACAVGYLNEENAGAFLRRMAIQARAAFDTWEDYLVSFVLGHAFFNNDMDYLQRLIRGGLVLSRLVSPFEGYQSPWQRVAIKSLPVLHSVRSTDTPETRIGA